MILNAVRIFFSQAAFSQAVGSASPGKEILDYAAAACAFAPDDVKYRYSLDAYRWRAITRVRDPDTNALRYNARTIGYAGQIVADLQQGADGLSGAA